MAVVVAAIWHALRVPNNICNYLFQFASIVQDANSDGDSDVAVDADSAVVAKPTKYAL